MLAHLIPVETIRKVSGLALAMGTVLGGLPLISAEAANPITTQNVSFTVQNINHSAIQCAVDGKTYQIKGKIVSPTKSIQADTGDRSITVYLHGLGGGQVIWSFDAVPNYNYASSMAQLGQTSLVIDQLGYGESGQPNGSDSCFGGKADIAHQIVQALRTGTYSVDEGSTPLPFKKVALAGLSSGGAIAQLESYSYHDIDALIVFSFADQDFSPAVQSALGDMGKVCQAGGEPAGGGTPDNYAYFAQTTDELQKLLFANADARVERTLLSIRTKDPCGDLASFGAVLGADQANLPSVSIPVLLVYGAKDAILLSTAGANQKARYSGSNDVTLITLNATGHILPLERPAPELRARVAQWLRKHEF